MTKREIEHFFGVDDHDKGMAGNACTSRRSDERPLLIDDQRKQSKNILICPSGKERNPKRRQ